MNAGSKLGTISRKIPTQRVKRGMEASIGTTDDMYIGEKRGRKNSDLFSHN
jgi:hypothetical protein